MRAVIVGAGPSGFYAADQLLAAGFEVDLLDALPTPFGLVRAGVAPDHPNIKAVTRVYEKTAAKPGFRFFGGVRLGEHVTRADLRAHYHAVLYALGTSDDNRLGIPGEDRPGSHAATSFVAWYNGHPDAADHEFDLSVDRAVVIGNGNVAIDVARMLVLHPDELGVTDTADHAIEAFGASQVQRGRAARPPRPGAGGVHEPGAARACRPHARRRRGRPDGPGARRAQRALAGGGGRRDGPPQRRDPADVRGGDAEERVASRDPALPALAGRDPRRRGRRPGDRRAGRQEPDRAVRARRACAPCRPARRRSSSAGSCCARSAIAAGRWTTSRSTSAAA